MYRRRSYGGYRRSYRRKSGGARVRRTLKAQMSAADQTLTTQSLNVPVDSTKNIGINIHEFRVEQNAAINVATKYSAVWLNRNVPAAERFISDVDCIVKVKHYCSTAVGDFPGVIMREKLYPPVPVFQDEIRLCAYQNSGQTVTYYVEVAYTLAWMSVGQIVGIAKNIII